MDKLSGKNIVIIGASGGIGRVLARSFLFAGANVTLSARTENKLVELKENLLREGGVEGLEERVLVAPGDASNPNEVEKIFHITNEIFNRIDAVVIAAGTWHRLHIDSPIPEAIELADKHFQALFLPTFITGMVAQNFFRKQGHGLLINISSHAALRPELSGNLTYGPMKAAAHHFILGLAHELRANPANKNIRLSDLSPAIVNTTEAAALLDTSEKRAAAVQPEEIADWIIANFDNPEIPDSKLFDSSLIL